MINKSNMIRFMVYLNIQKFSSLDANFILKKGRKLVETHDVIVRDCRVSKFFIELDISNSREEKIENIIDLLKEISSLKEFIEVKERVFKKKKRWKEQFSYLTRKNIGGHMKYWRVFGKELQGLKRSY